jgi:hypothetical protein
MALLLSGIGLFWTSLTCGWAVLWFSICAALALYLLSEASCSHQLLGEVRHEILKGAVVYPSLTQLVRQLLAIALRHFGLRRRGSRRLRWCSARQ